VDAFGAEFHNWMYICYSHSCRRTVVFHKGFGKLRFSMVLERMIVGSIPRRILGRFRASGGCRTRPPRQGLLSTNIPNSMFLFLITGSVPDIFHLSSRWLSAIGYWLFAKR
jgi:hypothetical protein